MNPVLAELLETEVAISESGECLKVHSHIGAEEGRFLERLVAEVKPEVSVEVGLGYGISTLFICEALSQLPKARHIAIDRYQLRGSSTHMSFESVGLHNLRRAGYQQMVELRAEPSYLALPALVAQGIKADFAFIDGWHTFDYASTDFFYVDLLLRPGGVVAIDDTDFRSVWKLCRYIITNRAYRVVGTVPMPDVRTRHPLRWLRWNLPPRIARGWWRAMHRDGLLPHSRCIAFRKEADDSRPWNFHKRF
jgi:predicted O-methyltransferase YrrM